MIIFCVYICIQLMNQKNGTTLSFSWLVNVKHFLLLFLFLLWISQRGFACMIVLLRERDHKEDFIKMMLLLKTWILVLKSNHRDESWKKKGTEESDIYMCMYKICKCIAWKCVEEKDRQYFKSAFCWDMQLIWSLQLSAWTGSKLHSLFLVGGSCHMEWWSEVNYRWWKFDEYKTAACMHRLYGWKKSC